MPQFSNYTAATYDSADRLTTITYPTGEALTYAYDAGWRQTSVCSNLYACYATAASYTALDQPSSITLGSGVQQSYTYQSPMARLGRLQVTSAGNSLFDRSYGYDNVGNVQTIVNNLNAEQQTYGYDPLDRLTNWDIGNSVHEQYVYDTIGNLTSKAGVAYIYGATNNGPHQAKTVGGQTYSYDNNGNLTSGGGRNYTWNAENQPSSISYNAGSNNESYVYDADGERVSNSVGVGLGQTTTYYIGGLYEFDSVGNTRLLYQFGGQTVAQRTIKPSGANNLYYLHGDQLGSVSLMTGATGNVISSQEFKPWGEVRSGGVSQTTLNYTGQRKDDTGLLYYHARYYDPVLARFVSGDSIMPKLKNPQNLNRYSYVDNAPLNHTDPTGHCRTYDGDSRPNGDPECEFTSQGVDYATSDEMKARDTLTDDDLRGAYDDAHLIANLDSNLKLAVDKDGKYPARFVKVDKALTEMENRLLYLLGSGAGGSKVNETIKQLEHDLGYAAYVLAYSGQVPKTEEAIFKAYNDLVVPALQLPGSVGGIEGGWTKDGGYNPNSRLLRSLHLHLESDWLSKIMTALQQGWTRTLNGKRDCDVMSACRLL
ncbi:MAG: hypothetical protein DLM69_00315 [Candidatus Chloroheliales bacterium]|nr:MAG: hypothetical protein DLM69_00315 [Chloroflexota bacterium]